MTDVSNLDNLAAAIATGSAKIRNYAIAQAAASQSQEVDIRVLLSRPPSAPKTEVATFSRMGVLEATSGVGRFLFPATAKITGVIAAVNTAPTGAAILIDVNKNGTSLFSTQGNRPSIAAGTYKTGATAVPNVTSVAAGDYLSVDIDQVGSTIAGADLVVQVIYQFV